MDIILESAAIAALTIFIFMNIIFLVGLVTKDNSYIDVAWGIGFVITAISLSIFNGRSDLVNIIAVVLTTLWGIRLGTHIGIRKLKHKGEDFRYKNWRETWNNFILRSYFQIFMLQGLMMFIISIPMIVISSNTSDELSIVTAIGIIIWSIGFLFEAVGDYQLTKFIQKKKTHNDDKNFPQIMKTGLWKYTRHPNYFGETVLWWGLFFIALNFEYGILTIISPLVIGFLMLRVSGIPMLERKYKDNKEFQEYAKKTSAYFPLPRKVKLTL